MKNNSGVTLMAVVTAVVIIIILAGITIYYGISQNANKATETKTTYEVYEIIDAVHSRNLMNRLNPQYYTYVGDKDFDKKVVAGVEYRASDGWYLLNSTNLKELGLDNVTGEFLVNYKDGLVVSTVGILYQDKVYFSLNDLKKAMGGGSSVLTNAEFDDEKGVNRPVLSDGMIPVRAKETSWYVTTADSDAWYDYSADQKAWANVMLLDELSVKDGNGTTYTNEEVRNMSIAELDGMEVVSEGSAYVWIPRYTTTNTENPKIIFSRLTNDVFNYDGDDYFTPTNSSGESIFTYKDGDDDINLTGIWISKYEASFSE